jgi:hypothetical protein
MFKCQVTGAQTQANEPAHRLVTHIRQRTYYRHNPKTGQDEVIGQGSEIVREALVCKEFYQSAMANSFQPTVVK